MKKLVTGLTLLSVTSMAQAAPSDVLKRKWDETIGISKLYGGFSNTTSNIAISHERRKGSLGGDGFLLSSEIMER